MVFAAGVGSRLRPLTDRVPKALIEIGGRPLLEIVLTRLMRFGVDSAVVNVHHEPGQIEAFLRESRIEVGLHGRLERGVFRVRRDMDVDTLLAKLVGCVGARLDRFFQRPARGGFTGLLQGGLRFVAQSVVPGRIDVAMQIGRQHGNHGHVVLDLVILARIGGCDIGYRRVDHARGECLIDFAARH